MEILFLLIPLSVVLVFVIAVIFWWSLRSGQFEDLEGPAYRVLMDDDRTTAGDPENPAPERENGANRTPFDPDQQAEKP